MYPFIIITFRRVELQVMAIKNETVKTSHDRHSTNGSGTAKHSPSENFRIIELDEGIIFICNQFEFNRNNMEFIFIVVGWNFHSTWHSHRPNLFGRSIDVCWSRQLVYTLRSFHLPWVVVDAFVKNVSLLWKTIRKIQNQSISYQSMTNSSRQDTYTSFGLNSSSLFRFVEPVD